MPGSSVSTSTSTGDSFIPDYPQSPLLMEISNYARQQASAMMSWGQAQYARNARLTDQVLHEAAIFASPERQALEMGRAEAGVGQAAEAGRQNALRDLEKFGIDPSSGRYASLDRAERSKEAAAKAGAGQQAQRATEATGRQLRTEGMNAQLANTQIGANLMRIPNEYLKTASDLKYPPLGHRQASQSNSSSSQNEGGGGSKSQGGDKDHGRPSGPPGGGSGPGGVGGFGRGSSGEGGSGGERASGSNYSGGPGRGWGNPGITKTGGPGSHNDANWMYGLDPQQMADDYSSYYHENDGTYNYDFGSPGDFGELYSNGEGYNYPDDNYADSPDAGGYDDQYGSTGSTDDTDYSQYGGDDSWGGSANDNTDYSSYGGDDSWGGGYDSSSDNSGWGDSSGDAGWYDDYAKGGAVPPIRPTTGGAVPRQASPSQGARTDDVPANLNVGEFVIPKDVAAWKGQEFFQKLIMTSRKNRVTNAPAQGKPSQQAPKRPTFSSQQTGMG